MPAGTFIRDGAIASVCGVVIGSLSYAMMLEPQQRISD